MVIENGNRGQLFKMTAFCPDQPSCNTDSPSSRCYKKLVKMLEKNVQEHAGEVYSVNNLAESLLQANKLDEAIDVYAHAYSTEKTHQDDLEALVQALVEKGKGNVQLTSSINKTKNVFQCAFCHCVLFDPITLYCGHTFCKKCIFNIEEEYFQCKNCSSRIKKTDLHKLTTNKTIICMLEKFCGKKLQAVKLKELGDTQMKEEKHSDAVKFYTDAHKLDPNNNFILDCLSHVLLLTGKQEEALKCAEKSISLNSTRSKSFYHKGEALVSLGRYKDAILAYLRSVVLDSTDLSSKQRIKKVMHKLLKSSEDLNYSQIEDKRLLLSKRGRKQEETESLNCSKNLQTEWKGFDKRKWVQRRDKLQDLVDKMLQETEEMKDIEPKITAISLETMDFDKKDMECSLCIRLFWQPVTTPCGHTFCRMCLDRSFDHTPQCPLCKSSLSEFLVVKKHVTEFIDFVLEKFHPNEYKERKKIFQDEMEELSSAGKDPEHGVPLFVCTMAYPSIPCPLHIFEPRYRLMTRQCVESGTRQFGMCASQVQEPDGIAPFGTMLNIREIMYYPDGRSVVDAIGGKRFKVLQLSMRDGYNVGSIEFIYDVSIPEGELIEVQVLHDSVYTEVSEWFNSLPQEKRSRILQHFGPLPEVEGSYWVCENGPNWMWWTIAILPLEVNIQVKLLGMDSLSRRLKSLQRVLNYLQRHGPTGVSH